MALFVCLACHIVGDNVYGLGKLVPYVPYFTFVGCLRPYGKDLGFGEEIIILWN